MAVFFQYGNIKLNLFKEKEKNDLNPAIFFLSFSWQFLPLSQFPEREKRIIIITTPGCPITGGNARTFVKWSSAVLKTPETERRAARRHNTTKIENAKENVREKERKTIAGQRRKIAANIMRARSLRSLSAPSGRKLAARGSARLGTARRGTARHGDAR